MPVAIETTKRKFQQLLDGLTSSSSSTTSLPSAKRVRLAPSSRSYSQSKPRIAIPSLPKEQTQASPWSQQAFLARLSTYTSLSRWTPKPSAINEVAWAKRGWECVQAPGVVNTVVCKGNCEARLVVSLRPRSKDEEGKDIEGTEDTSFDPPADLVERYGRLIEESHAEGCIWKGEGNACKDDIYRLMIARPSVWQPQLRERYRSFEQMGDKLPALDVLVLPSAMEETPKSLLGILFEQQRGGGTDDPHSSTPNVEPATERQINRVALSLALLGWRGTNESPKGPYAVATCDACFRRLGLWLFAKRKPTHGTDAEDGEAMTLDAVGEHREYCPWVNAESQCMTGALKGKAAWEVLQTLIKNDAARTALPEDASRPTTPAGGAIVAGTTHHTEDADGAGAQALDASNANKSRADIAEEDCRRFAKLRELSKSMGLKRWRLKQARDGAKAPS